MTGFRPSSDFGMTTSITPDFPAAAYQYSERPSLNMPHQLGMWEEALAEAIEQARLAQERSRAA